jgi:hypothetical protein
MSLLVWTVSAGLGKALQSDEPVSTTTPTEEHIHQQGTRRLDKCQDAPKTTEDTPSNPSKKKRSKKQAKKKNRFSTFQCVILGFFLSFPTLSIGNPIFFCHTRSHEQDAERLRQ